MSETQDKKLNRTVVIPINPNKNWELRQAEITDSRHAKLLGLTFTTLLIADTNPDFVKSVFDELSKHYIRKTFENLNQLDQE